MKEFSSVRIEFMEIIDDGVANGDARTATSVGRVDVGMDIAAAIQIVPRPLLTLAEAVTNLAELDGDVGFTPDINDAEEDFVSAAEALRRAWDDHDAERDRRVAG